MHSWIRSWPRCFEFTNSGAKTVSCPCSLLGKHECLALNFNATFLSFVVKTISPCRLLFLAFARGSVIELYREKYCVFFNVLPIHQRETAPNFKVHLTQVYISKKEKENWNVFPRFFLLCVFIIQGFLSYWHFCYPFSAMKGEQEFVWGAHSNKNGILQTEQQHVAAETMSCLFKIIHRPHWERCSWEIN